MTDESGVNHSAEEEIDYRSCNEHDDVQIHLEQAY